MPFSGHGHGHVREGSGFICGASCPIVPFAAVAQTAADTLPAEQLKSLVKDKTWASRLAASLRIPLGRRTGISKQRLAVRPAARQQGGPKCADAGQWKLQGDAICWQFQWIGETYGYKSLCVRVRKADEKNVRGN